MDYHIFFINLVKCVKKKQKMIKKLEGHKYTIINGYDGTNLSIKELHNMNGDILKEWKDPHSGRNITWGEIGCALSHYKIYKYCLDNNINNAIIFEDDVDIPKNLNLLLENTFRNLSTELPNEWEFCYISRKPMIPKKDINHTPNFISPAYSYWMCGYIINLKGMEKIINSGFIKKIIPIDEFIPIIGNFSPLTNYKKNYTIDDKLRAFSVKNLFIQPENNAFLYSQTENTQEVDISDNNLLLLATGTHMTDGLKRFINSCKIYGLNYKIMGLGQDWKGGNMSKFPGGGQKVNLLLNTITDMEDDKIILVTDSYDVIMNANSKEILDKYKKFNKPIVFATESSCWPDKDNAKKFPKILNKKNLYLNSGGFIGNVKTIKYIISKIPNNADDQRFYQNMFLSLSGEKYIALDYECEIFQCLNDAEEEIDIHYSKSRVYNKKTQKFPCHIHGNGPLTRKNFINRLESYLMKNWTNVWGYNKKNMLSTNKLKKNITIYIHLVETTDNKDIIKYMDNIIHDNIEELKKYIPNITIYGNTQKIQRNVGIKNAIEKKADYYWLLDTTYIINNSKTLLNLILNNKGVISPALSKKNDYWSNYWGATDKYGWYSGSFDYIDLVTHKKKGCWNVPHIGGNILVRNDYLQKIENFFTNNSGNNNFTIDMYFSDNCRNNNIFMYVENTQEYGYIYSGIKDVIPDKAKKNSLYLFETNKDIWAKKYLHKDFYEAINDLDKLKVDEPCKWVFEFPFVNELFCDELLNETNNINNWSPGGNVVTKDSRINSVENVPTQDIHMNQIGFRKQWESIVKTYIAPLVSKLYSPFKTNGLNIAFVVKYEMGNQEYLNPHHDSSAYSINITLNTPEKDFTGGGTRFIKQNVSVQGKKGYCTLHPGKLTHYHEGLPITSGKRFIFVSFVN